MPPVDRAGLLRGAWVSVAWCLPVAVLTTVLVEPDRPSALKTPLFLAILVGFAFGGAAGARRSTISPLVTGALGALLGFAALAVVDLLVGDHADGIAAIVFQALLAYGCGLTGAVLGERRRAQA